MTLNSNPRACCWAVMTPQVWATSSFTGSRRPTKVCLKSSSSRAKDSFRRPTGRRSIPRRSSAIEMTLTNASSSTSCSSQDSTRASGARLLGSERTLVSSSRLKDRYHAAGPSAAPGQGRDHRNGSTFRNSSSVPLRRVRASHSFLDTTTTASRPWRVIVCGPSVSARSMTSLKRAFASATGQLVLVRVVTLTIVVC